MRNNSPWLLFVLALALMVLPLWWIFAALLAAIWHECCHFFALHLYGGRALGFRAGVMGAVMEVRFSSPGQELVCALAGPVGSLLLLLMARWLPRTAICAGFQGLYNLLPIYPLDGGRVVRCLSQLWLPPEIGNDLCQWLEKICLLGLMILAVYGCFVLHLGIAPILVGAWMICRIKIPCKPCRNSVQWGQKIQ